jgi:hypothetical protein
MCVLPWEQHGSWSYTDSRLYFLVHISFKLMSMSLTEHLGELTHGKSKGATGHSNRKQSASKSNSSQSRDTKAPGKGKSAGGGKKKNAKKAFEGMADFKAQQQAKVDTLKDQIRELKEELKKAGEPLSLVKQEVALTSAQTDLLRATDNYESTARASSPPVFTTLPPSDPEEPFDRKLAGPKREVVVVGKLYNAFVFESKWMRVNWMVVSLYFVLLFALTFSFAVFGVGLVRYDHMVIMYNCTQYDIHDEKGEKEFITWLKTFGTSQDRKAYRDVWRISETWRLPYIFCMEICRPTHIETISVYFDFWEIWYGVLWGGTTYFQVLGQRTLKYGHYTVYTPYGDLFAPGYASLVPFTHKALAFYIWLAIIYILTYSRRLGKMIDFRHYKSIPKAHFFKNNPIRSARLVAQPIKTKTLLVDRRPEMDRSERLSFTHNTTYQLLVEIEWKTGFTYQTKCKNLPSYWYITGDYTKCRLKTVELNSGLLATLLNRRTMVATADAPELAVEAALRLMQSSPHYQENYDRLLLEGRSTYRDMALVCGAIVSQNVYHNNLHF